MRTPALGTLTPTWGMVASQYDRLSSNTGWAAAPLMRWGWLFTCSVNESAFRSENGASYTWMRERHGCPAPLRMGRGWASMGRISP
jgi:hypothetical protein